MSAGGIKMRKYQAVIQKWQEKEIVTVEDLDTVLNNFRVVFAYHSGAIENPEINYHTTREIFENGKLINFSGNLRTVFEIENQKKCYEFLKEKIINREPVSEELIKEIHKKLTQGTYDETRWKKGERPGEYKKNDYMVADGQGALPADVPDEMKDLCKEMTDVPDKGENILKAAAYLHCKFENIHGFADGNGRVGRTIMNYFLMIHNYPPLVIFNDTKNKYYQALGIYDKTGSIEEFAEYMKTAMEETWEIKRAPEIGLENFLER